MMREVTKPTGFVLAMLLAGNVHAASEPAIGECAAPGAEPVASTERPLFSYEGAEFFSTDLPTQLQQALFDLELEHYQKRLDLVHTAVLRMHIDELVAASGRAEEEVVNELLAVAPPDDAAVQQFYEENIDRIGLPLEVVEEQIRRMLSEQAAREKRHAVLGSMRSENALEVSVAKPVAPFVEIDSAGFPRKGPASAPITIVEFADYQCPHCKTAAAALASIAAEYPNEVQLVFMDFPVNPSGISREVAKGAACAAKQERFWAYHDLAFEQQADLSRRSPTKIAQALGLDEAVFAECLDSPDTEAHVAASEEEAKRLGVTGTPTLFLNGRRLVPRDLDEDVREAISRVLADKAS